MTLSVITRNNPEFLHAWQDLSGKHVARNALYVEQSQKFYETQRDAQKVADLSFIIAKQSSGLLGMQMQAFRNADGKVDISCHGLPCYFGESRTASASDLTQGKKLFKTAFRNRIVGQAPVSDLFFHDYQDNGRVNLPGQILLGMGARTSAYLSQVIDLSAPEGALRAALTKTVRWSINWGQKNLAIVLADKNNVLPDQIEAFRLLHIEASGRETRNKETWAVQLEMVRKGEAFLVLGYLENSLVTAALFIHSSQHCCYGVSASKRELFNKPISHAIIWKAVLHAKNNLKLSHFEMGTLTFPRLNNITPSDKELGISFFKRSFGGDTESRLVLNWRSTDVSSQKAPSPA